MQTFDYYEVTCSFDRDVSHIANFVNLDDAKSFCQGNAYYSISPKKVFMLCENLYEAVTYKKEVERQRVLSKLTRRERQILGLEE